MYSGSGSHHESSGGSRPSKDHPLSMREGQNDFHFSTQLRKGGCEVSSEGGTTAWQALTSLCSPTLAPLLLGSIDTAPHRYPPAANEQASSSSSVAPPITPSAYYTHLSVSDVLASLSPHPSAPINPLHGLSSDHPASIRSRLPWSTVTSDSQGQQRTVRGYNEFAVKESDSAWSKLADQLKEPLILLLLGSAVVSLILGEREDAASIVLAVGIVVAGESELASAVVDPAKPGPLTSSTIPRLQSPLYRNEDPPSRSSL